MIDLAGLRRAVGLTQVELADALGTSQGQISRMERQGDMLLSSLTSYLSALGVIAEIVIEVGGQTVTHHLTAKSEEA
jgi:predicted transcriptional regulator